MKLRIGQMMMTLQRGVCTKRRRKTQDEEGMVQIPEDLFGFGWLSSQLHRAPNPESTAPSETTPLREQAAGGLTWRAKAVYALLIFTLLFVMWQWQWISIPLFNLWFEISGVAAFRTLCIITMRV